MRKKFFISILALTLLAILTFPQTELRACSCIVPPPPANEFENSDAVFLGTVTSFKIESSELRLRKANIRLRKLWKGDKDLADEVFTSLDSDECGFGFEVGETYLIYAWINNDGNLATNICSRTSHVDMATEDLAFLSQVPPLFSQDDSAENSGDDSGCCGGTASSGDAILAGLFLFFLSRKSKVANSTKTQRSINKRDLSL